MKAEGTISPRAYQFGIILKMDMQLLILRKGVKEFNGLNHSEM